MSDAPSMPPTPRAGVNLTPAMRQYVEQKAAAGDALLLFRMGDFYETFFEDARTAARVLGITLTSRGKGADEVPIPLAGIPYHALESYLTKLVHAGYKVAISEQVEDPKAAKGVVRREIVRIVTPGTLTEDALLEKGADNYLACICRTRDEVGLAFVELSTGAFAVQLTTERALVDELARLTPAEIIVPEHRIDAADPLAAVLEHASGPGGVIPNAAVTRRPAHLFDPYQAEQRLLTHFGTATLEGFGFGRMDASLCAAAVIVDYLAETQKSSLAHILSLHRRRGSDFVYIDESTWRSLEIERTLRSGSAAGSLLQAVDRTCTAMGARCLRRWLAMPLRDADRIRRRHDAVAELLGDPHQLGRIRAELRQLADVERITARLGVGRATPRDLVALGQTLFGAEAVGDLLDELARCSAAEAMLLRSLANTAAANADAAVEMREKAASSAESAASAGENANRFVPLKPSKSLSQNPCGTGVSPVDFRGSGIGGKRRPMLSGFLTFRREAMAGLHDLAVYLTASLAADAPLVLNEGGIIAPGFDAELDRLRSIGDDGRQWLADFQAREVERSGIGSLKVGFNQVFGYYIEITNAHRSRIPADYVRKQTLKNAERYITDELKKYETEVLTARDRAIAREIEMFEVIRQRAVEHMAAMQRLATAVAEVDVVAGFAHLADERRYARPELIDEPVVDITDGRHPVLEQMLVENFVPNNCHLQAMPGRLGKAARAVASDVPSLVVLTGPNMAGKSTYIRQVALLTLLAQTGSFVPAAAMRFGPVDRVFARVGASDEISRGQSTFMVEMTEAANILHSATRHSLVVIDELGRGTSTFDGLSLAWAIAEDLVSRVGCRTLFATHYHELTQLQEYLQGVANWNVDVREWQEQIVFLHRIVPGGADKSYGAHVAKLAGVPGAVIQRSRQLLAELESNFTSDRRAPVRSARRDTPEEPLLLFADPADQVVKELRHLDPNTVTPIDALRLLEEWRRRLQ